MVRAGRHEKGVEICSDRIRFFLVPLVITHCLVEGKQSGAFRYQYIPSTNVQKLKETEGVLLTILRDQEAGI